MKHFLEGDGVDNNSYAIYEDRERPEDRNKWMPESQNPAQILIGTNRIGPCLILVAGYTFRMTTFF